MFLWFLQLTVWSTLVTSSVPSHKRSKVTTGKVYMLKCLHFLWVHRRETQRYRRQLNNVSWITVQAHRWWREVEQVYLLYDLEDSLRYDTILFKGTQRSRRQWNNVKLTNSPSTQIMKGNRASLPPLRPRGFLTIWSTFSHRIHCPAQNHLKDTCWTLTVRTLSHEQLLQVTLRQPTSVRACMLRCGKDKENKAFSPW